MVAIVIQIISFICIILSIIAFKKRVKPHHVRGKDGFFYPFAFLLSAFILFFISYIIEKYL